MKSVPQRGSVGSAIHQMLRLILRAVMRTANPTLPRYGTDFIQPQENIHYLLRSSNRADITFLLRLVSPGATSRVM
jgi:hypothetical protein